MINLPVEILSRERLYLQAVKSPRPFCYYLADEDEIDLTRATKIRTAYDPWDDNKEHPYIVFRYTCSDGINRSLCLPDEPEQEITAEDYAEWCSASCGVGYYTYIGKPWLD